MKLREQIELYDGDVLFSIRETNGSNEKILISCKTGEQIQLKEDLLDREIDKIRIEITEHTEGLKQKHNVIFVIVLKGVITP